MYTVDHESWLWFTDATGELSARQQQKLQGAGSVSSNGTQSRPASRVEGEMSLLQ
jgi:hypothetical protein